MSEWSEPGTNQFCAACGSRCRWNSPCPVCGQVTYLNPRPCGGALILDEGRVLLGLRTIDPWRNHWDLPGGFCEATEHPSETVAREVEEELGVECVVESLVGVFVDYAPTGVTVASLTPWSTPTVSVFYSVRLLGLPEATVSDEFEDARFFSLDAIPAKIAFPDLTEQVLEAARHL